MTRGLTRADSELVAATLTTLDGVPRGLEVQPEGGLGSKGGVGTHSGNASFLVVAHTSVHCSYDEDVFSLGLTVEQRGGGDFTCRRGRQVREGSGGPGGDQGRRKERRRERGEEQREKRYGGGMRVRSKDLAVCMGVYVGWGEGQAQHPGLGS